MQKRKALSGKNTPRSLRLGTFAVILLVADRFNPTPFAWGIIIATVSILFLLVLLDFFNADDVELQRLTPELSRAAKRRRLE